MDCSPPGSSVHGDSPGKWRIGYHPPGDLPNPGIEPRSPTLQADSLPSEPRRKSRLLERESYHDYTVLVQCRGKCYLKENNNDN